MAPRFHADRHADGGPHTVTRNIGAFATLPNAAAVAAAMANGTFNTFAPALEGVHNSGHVWVGGSMGSIPTAPTDPVFWMHHAEIDRIWAEWQAANPGQNPPLAGAAATMDPLIALAMCPQTVAAATAGSRHGREAAGLRAGVEPAGLEPATSCARSRRFQLSHGPCRAKWKASPEAFSVQRHPCRDRRRDQRSPGSGCFGPVKKSAAIERPRCTTTTSRYTSSCSCGPESRDDPVARSSCHPPWSRDDPREGNGDMDQRTGLEFPLERSLEAARDNRLRADAKVTDRVGPRLVDLDRREDRRAVGAREPEFALPLILNREKSD